jgi:anaerobic selenocysteine-containing dehydrogenase
VGRVLQEGFYTASGKIELSSSALASSGYDPLPHYREPAESPLSTPEIARGYPLILITGGRYETYVHSQHRTIRALNRKYPEPRLELHPDTARQAGIEDGAWVLVESPRGAVRLRAAVTEGIMSGVVHLGHGWESANCNLLTDDMARDPISGFPALKSSLCRIRTMSAV